MENSVDIGRDREEIKKVTLRDLIKVNGLTMEKVASKLGVSRQQIYNVIWRRQLGSVDFWKRIQIAFNLSDSDAWSLMTAGYFYA